MKSIRIKNQRNDWDVRPNPKAVLVEKKLSEGRVAFGCKV